MQTKSQFKKLYGDERQWSNTVKAGFDHLFKGEMQKWAARDNGIKPPNLTVFLRSNKIKHVDRVEYCSLDSEVEQTEEEE